MYHSDGRHTYVEINKDEREIYSDEFTLQNWNSQNNVPIGHYSCPFSVVIPKDVPGTFYHDNDNFLKFEVSAFLAPLDQNKDRQTFRKNLTVLENLRAPYGPLLLSRMCNGNCCKCCIDYGQTKVTLMVDKNALYTEEILQMKAEIDNTAGSKEIDNVVVELKQHYIRCAGNDTEEKCE